MSLAAAFDSDAEKVVLSDSGDFIEDIVRDGSVYGPSHYFTDTPFELVPLIFPIGETNTSENLIGINLSLAYSEITADELTVLTKGMLVELQALIFGSSGRIEPFAILAIFTTTQPFADNSFVLLRRLLGCIAREMRKMIKRIYFLHGGLAIKTLLQTAKTSKKFWTKIRYLESIKEVMSLMRDTSEKGMGGIPLCAWENAKQIPRVSFHPLEVDMRFLSIKTGHNTRGCVKIPSLLSQLVLLLEQPSVIRERDFLHAKTTANEMYYFHGEIAKGTPMLKFENVGLLVVMFRLLLADIEPPLFGASSFDTFMAIESPVLSDKEVKNLLNDLITHMGTTEREIAKFLLIFFQNVASRSRENQLTAQSIADAFSHVFTRPEILTSQTFPVTRLVAQVITRLISDFQTFEPVFALQPGEKVSKHKHKSKQQDTKLTTYPIVSETPQPSPQPPKVVQPVVVSAPPVPQAEQEVEYEYEYVDEEGNPVPPPEGEEYEYEYVYQ